MVLVQTLAHNICQIENNETNIDDALSFESHFLGHSVKVSSASHVVLVKFRVYSPAFAVVICLPRGMARLSNLGG